MWRKSSRSGGNGQCVEVWRKSSRSGSNGQCVELGNVGAIRDSKNSDGPLIRVDLNSFVDSVRSGRFDR